MRRSGGDETTHPLYSQLELIDSLGRHPQLQGLLDFHPASDLLAAATTPRADAFLVLALFAVFVTVVVLAYQSVESEKVKTRWVHGVGSNFILNLKFAAGSENVELLTDDVLLKHNPALAQLPKYAIEGPRSAYKQDTIFKAPIHVRRSTFRLPTNPKSPVIMIGPGTVSTILLRGRCYDLIFL